MFSPVSGNLDSFVEPLVLSASSPCRRRRRGPKFVGRRPERALHLAQFLPVHLPELPSGRPHVGHVRYRTAENRTGRAAISAQASVGEVAEPAVGGGEELLPVADQ